MEGRGDDYLQQSTQGERAIHYLQTIRKGKQRLEGVCTERQMEMNEDKIKEGEGLLGKKQCKS